MEERIIVLALCSFSRVALFSEVVVSCSFSWILFLTARLGGLFESYAHIQVSISTRNVLLSKRLRRWQDSLVVFSEKAERKIYAPVCSQIRSNGDKETSFVDHCVIRPQRLT